jgi:hypothetical protein
MTAPRDPDSILAAWLEEGPTRLPDGTHRAILVATRTSRPQRPRRWAPWRISMFSFTRVALAATVFLIVGLSGLNLYSSSLAPGSGPGGLAIDTSTWTPYVSDRYGFSIGHPAGWTELPADHTWTLAADQADPSSGAMDRLIAPAGDIRVGAWSVALEPGTTIEDGPDVDAWVEEYCQVTGTAPCTGIAERAVPLCLERRDCHPGLLVQFDDSVQAFFSGGIYDADKMVVVAIWNGASGAVVEPHGGSQQLLEAILSTMSVWPESVPLGARIVPDMPATSPS